MRNPPKLIEYDLAMTFTDYIKEAVRLSGRLWQLVAVQVGMSFAGCVGFFLIMGVPLVVAVVSLGLDLSEISRLKDFLVTVEDPFDVFRRYLGIGLLLISAFILYMLYAYSLWLFILGGTAGSLGSALADPSKTFGLRAFLRDAARMFLPLAGYTALTGLLFLGALFGLGVTGGVSAAVMALMGSSSVATILRLFLALTVILSGLIVTFGVMVLTMYGVAVIALEGLGPVRALKKTWSYLKERPRAMWLYAALGAGYAVAYGIFFLIGIGIGRVPKIGVFLGFGYQLVLVIIQGYLNLVMLAAVMNYYFTTRPSPEGIIPADAGSTPADAGSSPANAGSSPEGRILSESAPRQEPPPAEEDRT